MRRSSAACISLLVAATITLPGLALASEATPDPDLTVVRCGLYENPPLLFRNDEGEPDGFFPTVLEEVARAEGWRLEWVDGTWAECLDRVEKGQIDLLGPIGVTPDREAVLAFNNVTVYSNWGQVYARQGEETRYASLLDLAGVDVAVLGNDVYYTADGGLLSLAEGFDLEIGFVECDSYAEVLDRLASRDVDAGVVNRLYGSAHAGELGLVPTGVVFQPIEVRFALAPDAPNTPAVRRALDANLRALIADQDSAYYRALEQYVAPAAPEREAQLPEWVSQVLGMIAAAVIVLVVMLVYQRRLVRQRTTALQLANERMAAVIDAVPDAMFRMDLHGRFLEFKPARDFEAAIPPEQFLGRLPDELRLPDEMRGVWSDAVRRAAESAEHVTIEYTMPYPDGTLREFEARMVCSGSDEIVAIVRDITQRKADSRRGEQRRQELERVVRQRTADLLDANIRLEEASRAKSAFLANMSHELRTPLNSIIGFTDVMLGELAGPITDEQRKQLGMVRQAGRHLLSLLEDVLDITRVEAGRLEPLPAEFDLSGLIEEVLGLMRASAAEHGLALRVAAGDAPRTLHTDRRLLQQVLLNLLGNAIKFTDVGSVVLDVRASDTDRVTFSVSDTGRGIGSEELDSIFEPFVQGQDDRVAKPLGFGLGLTISRQLVRLLGGTMSVTSEAGRGSTFSVTVPRRIERDSRADADGD